MSADWFRREYEQPPWWLLLLIFVLLCAFGIVFLLNSIGDRRQAVLQEPADYAAVFRSPAPGNVQIFDYGSVPNTRFWFEVTSTKPLVLDRPETLAVVDRSEAEPWMLANRPWITKILHRKRLIPDSAPALQIGQGTPPERSELWVCSDATNTHCFVYGFYPVVAGPKVSVK